uniref:Cyclic nucleotide-binding domain-containing protein n=1 Tax=Lotharella globosa TaxID=91324 RepID=A0A7S4DPL4_9EUKA
MGGKISIHNDIEKHVSAVLLDRRRNLVESWNLKLKPGHTIEQRGDGVIVNEPYTLKLFAGNGSAQNESTKFERRFFAFYNNVIDLKVKISEILAKKRRGWLQLLQLKHLVGEVLPGVRIEDRDYYGEIYEECFIANELVTYLILHKVARSADLAVEMCSILLREGIFQEVIEGQEFMNDFIFFRLDDSHQVVRTQGRLQKSLDTWDNMSNYRFHTFTATASRMLSPRVVEIRAHEGWLEKKSKFGFWQIRFFRILPSDEVRSSSTLAYFNDTVSTELKGEVPTTDIQQVERYERDRSNRIICIKLVPESKLRGSVYLRAPNPDVCERWVVALQKFAKSLSPVDVVKRSALMFVFTDKMVREFAKRLELKKVRRGQSIEEFDTFYLLRQGKIGIFIQGKEGKAPEFYCERTPICFFGESVFHVGSRSPTLRSRRFSFSRSPKMESIKLSMGSRRLSMRSYGKSVIYKAMEESEILRLTPEHREAFLKNFGEVRGRLDVMLRVGIDRCLEKTPFFKELNAAQVAQLKMGLHFHSLKKDEVLFYEGEPGRDFFIVYAGTLVISQYDIQNGREVILKKLKKDDNFGEIALLVPGMPRTATVKATDDALLLSLDEDTFKSFMRLTQLDVNRIMKQVSELLWVCEERKPDRTPRANDSKKRKDADFDISEDVDGA